jgi:hypothetical protein
MNFSLTAILKCLFNYGIKIYQNIVYHLTIQKPYNVDRNMSGAASFANAIKSKSFDGSNFKSGVSWSLCGSPP